MNSKRNSSFVSSTMNSHNKAKHKGRKTELFPGRENPDPNSTIFEALMDDPEKRAIVMKLISTNKNAIEEYKRKEKANVNRLKQKFVLESPTALIRRRALQEKFQERASSPATSDSSEGKSRHSSPVPFNRILQGVKAYVEVLSRNEDRSTGVKALLIGMGATVRDTFTSDVSHVIFKDGSFQTYQKATILKKHLVSVLWVEAARTTSTRVPESDYPALGTENYDMNASTICEKLQSDYKEIIKDEMRKSLNVTPQTSQKVNKNRPKTTLPSTLQTIRDAWCSSNSTSDINCDDVIPDSQDDEVSSITSMKLPGSPSNFSAKLSTSSDDDSDCGVINGTSFTRTRSQLLIDDDLCNERLKLRKSLFKDKAATQKDKTVIQEVDMEITLDENDKRKVSFHSAGASSEELDAFVTRRRKNNFGDHEFKVPVTSIFSSTASTNSLLCDNSLIIPKNTKRNSNSEPTPRYSTETEKSEKRVSLSSAELSELRISTDSSHNESNSANDKLAEKNSPPKIKNLKKRMTLRSTELSDDEMRELPKRKIIDKENKSQAKISRRTVGSKAGTRKGGKARTTMPARILSDVSDIDNKTADSSSDNSETKKKRTRKLFNLNEIDDLLAKKLEEDSKKSEEEARRAKSIEKVPEQNNPLSAIILSNIILTSNAQAALQEVAQKGIDAEVVEIPKRKKKIANEEANNIIFNETRDEQMELLEEIVNPKTSSESCSVLEAETDDAEVIPETPFRKNNENDSPEGSIINETPVKTRTGYNNKTVFPQGSQTITPSTTRKPTFKEPSSSKTPKTQRLLKTPKSVQIAPETPLRKSGRKVKSSQDSLLIKPLNRRSTMEFMPPNVEVISQRKTQTQKSKRTTIVCTRFHAPEVEVFRQIVKKLGRFNVENEVTQQTSHLVVAEPSRTINILRAIARGIWLLKAEWLYLSLENKKWLPEEEFELVDFSNAVQTCRVERQTFGRLYSMDVFKNCGPIYIDRSTNPRCSDLEELVTLGSGSLERSPINAAIIVGQSLRYKNKEYVKETWVLDCITFNKCKNVKNYRLPLPPPLEPNLRKSDHF